MSRRHKDDIINKPTVKSELQGSHSQESQSTGTNKRSDLLSNFTIVRRDSSETFSADYLATAIAKSFAQIEGLTAEHLDLFCTDMSLELKIPNDYTFLFKQMVLEEYRKIDYEYGNSNRRGKRIVEKLLGRFENQEVCSWFDKLYSIFNNVVNSLKQILCCFFWALFDLVTTENPFQKVACFYRLMKGHIKDKIPGLRTIQNGIKWFKGWRKEVVAWKNRLKEEYEHGLWERLYQLIKEQLPQLEPKLAFC